jgi:hypothetical protein
MSWANTVWRRLLAVVEEQGYVIVAVNTDSVDYVACAVRLAESLKHFHPDVSVCLISDQKYAHPVFDHVRTLAPDSNNAYANDWQVFRLSPYRETVKLEADMLIASPVDHWWALFRNRDVVVSVGCRDWYDRVSNSRYYRQVFDNNHLPDVYNAVTYWRLSSTAKDFFDTVKHVFANWIEFKTLLKFAPDEPDTDLVYAMAAQIVGVEQCTLPAAYSPKIVHMKQHIAGTHSNNWTQELVWETDPLRINTVAQWGVFHYHVKDWKP